MVDSVFLLESLDTPIPTPPLLCVFALGGVPRIIRCPGYVLIRETFGLLLADVYGCVFRLSPLLALELLPKLNRPGICVFCLCCFENQ